MPDADERHPELVAGMASAHDDGVYNGHPVAEPTPQMNAIESNTALRDELLGGPGKVSPSQGVR